MVITFYIYFDWTNRIFPQISQFPHLIHSLIYLYDVKGNYFPSYTSNIYVSLEVLEAPGLQLFLGLLTLDGRTIFFTNPLSSLDSHWLRDCWNSSRIIQGCGEVWRKKSEDFRKPLETNRCEDWQTKMQIKNSKIISHIYHFH